MTPARKRTAGIALTVVGSLLLLGSCGFGIFDIYVLIEDQGNDAAVAWPLLGGTCLCSLISLVVVGGGAYLIRNARKESQTESDPSVSGPRIGA